MAKTEYVLYVGGPSDPPRTRPAGTTKKRAGEVLSRYAALLRVMGWSVAGSATKGYYFANDTRSPRRVGIIIRPYLWLAPWEKTPPAPLPPSPPGQSGAGGEEEGGGGGTPGRRNGWPGAASSLAG